MPTQEQLSALGPLSYLIGTWTNQNLPGTAVGGQQQPYSYNTMPLPQEKSIEYPHGYILKNFRYYEKITFGTLPDIPMKPGFGGAPNRGGEFTQQSNALFYDQTVHFAEGPSQDQVIHVENGSWLHLNTKPQLKGPYPIPAGNPTNHVPPPTSGIPPQPLASTIAKQISVPHGNSILVLGGIWGLQQGAPTIEPYDLNPYFAPQGLSREPYTNEGTDQGNPHPELNPNPTQPLQDALAARSDVKEYYRWDVDTNNPGGIVTNIPFEVRKAKVTRYHATYWLQKFQGDTTFLQLSYAQTIFIEITIDRTPYEFAHVTCNVLTAT